MTNVVSMGPCCRCGEAIYAPAAVKDVYLRNHQNFYCIHGHGQHYSEGKSREQKLQEQLDDMQRRAQRAEQRVAQESDRAEHHKARAASYKGQVTKIKKRVGAGICLCCNRHFENLARHMAGQHPDFQPEGEDQNADVSH